MSYLQKNKLKIHSLSKIKNQEKPILLYCVCGAFSSALNR